MKPIHIFVPVWGDHIKTYLQWIMPTHIACLRQFHPRGDRVIVYMVFTDNPQPILQAPLWSLLQELAGVQVMVMPPKLTSQKNKYQIKSDIYRIGLRISASSDPAKRGIAFLLNADVVLCQEFMLNAAEKIAQGYKVIQVLCPRGKRDEIGREIAAFNADPARFVEGPNSIELAKIWLQNMHPSLDMHMVEGDPRQPFHPSHLYWRAGNEGIVARAYHHYPIVIAPDEMPQFHGTIDDDLVAALKIQPTEMYFPAYSYDGLFCCELSPPGNPMVRICDRGDFNAQLQFYKSYAEARDLDYLRNETAITGALDGDPVVWAEAGLKARAYTSLIFQAFGRTL